MVASPARSAEDARKNDVDLRMESPECCLLRLNLSERRRRGLWFFCTTTEELNLCMVNEW